MSTPTNRVLKALGYVQDTSIDTAQALPSIPQGATRARIQVTAQAARWRDDGTAPTASVGMPLAVGSELVYEGNLATIKIISAVAGAVLNVAYYG